MIKKNDLKLIEGYIEKDFLKPTKEHISKDILIKNRPRLPDQSVYKYFSEDSRQIIEKKLQSYKKDPKDLKLYNELVNRLKLGLKTIEEDIKKLPKNESDEKWK